MAEALPRVEAAAGVPLRVVEDTQFLCSRAAFSTWAGERKRLRMQEFYAWMRRTHDVLMDGTLSQTRSKQSRSN